MESGDAEEQASPKLHVVRRARGHREDAILAVRHRIELDDAVARDAHDLLQNRRVRHRIDPRDAVLDVGCPSRRRPARSDLNGNVVVQEMSAHPINY